MKRILLAALLTASLIAPAHAKGDKFQMCRTLTKFYESIVESRDAGVTFSKMMELAEAQGAGFREGVAPTIAMAYDNPGYYTKDRSRMIFQYCMETK